MSWKDVLREGRWADWPGLPADLTEPQLLDVVDFPSATRERARLGWQRLQRVQAGENRYWLEGDIVKLVELVNPPNELTPDELRERLGRAERESAGRHQRFDATTWENVYPARGIALTVASSIDEPERFAPFVAQVLLFAPTDLTSFVTVLGGNDKPGPAH
jgi:hypothetical protein